MSEEKQEQQDERLGAKFSDLSDEEVEFRKDATVATLEQMLKMAKEKRLPTVFLVIMDAANLQEGMAVQNTFAVPALSLVLGNAVAGLVNHEAGVNPDAAVPQQNAPSSRSVN